MPMFASEPLNVSTAIDMTPMMCGPQIVPLNFMASTLASAAANNAGGLGHGANHHPIVQTTELHDEKLNKVSINPSNLSMTTSITSALCAHSSMAGPHILPACSPLLQLAVRQALGACLPNFDKLSIKGELEVSVGFKQCDAASPHSTTTLRFSDGIPETRDLQSFNNIVQRQPSNFQMDTEMTSAVSLTTTATSMVSSTSNCVGSSKRKSSNPTKWEAANETTNQSSSPTSSTSSLGLAVNSAPTSPSGDSGVLDLSRNGSLAGSAPMTPMKEQAVSMDSLNMLNSQHLLQVYHNQLATLNQLQAAALAANPISGHEMANTTHANALTFSPNLMQSLSASVSPVQTTSRRPRVTNRVSSTTSRGGQSRRLNPNRRFPCNQCDEEFPSLQTLEEHTMRLHGSYRCHICNAQFTQRSNLQRHALKHVGFKPFECRVCGKSYYRKDHLMRHMEMGHPGYSPRDYITVHLTSSESLEFLNRTGLGQVSKNSTDSQESPLEPGHPISMEVEEKLVLSEEHTLVEPENLESMGNLIVDEMPDETLADGSLAEVSTDESPRTAESHSNAQAQSLQASCLSVYTPVQSPV